MINVDSHQHFWRLDRGDYGWLQPTPALRRICRDFDLDELRPQLTRAGVDATLLVQAAPTPAETRYLLEVAAENPNIVLGVVGWADLRAPDAPHALAELARNRRLKGVRPMFQDEPDAAWILRPYVQAGLAALPALGLRFDALVKPAHLRALLQMLERHPDLAVVVETRAAARPREAR